MHLNAWRGQCLILFAWFGSYMCHSVHMDLPSRTNTFTHWVIIHIWAQHFVGKPPYVSIWPNKSRTAQLWPWNIPGFPPNLQFAPAIYLLPKKEGLHSCNCKRTWPWKIHHFDGIYQERRGFSWAMLVSGRVHLSKPPEIQVLYLSLNVVCLRHKTHAKTPTFVTGHSSVGRSW